MRIWAFRTVSGVRFASKRGVSGKRGQTAGNAKLCIQPFGCVHRPSRRSPPATRLKTRSEAHANQLKSGQKIPRTRGAMLAFIGFGDETACVPLARTRRLGVGGITRTTQPKLVHSKAQVLAEGRVAGAKKHRFSLDFMRKVSYANGFVNVCSLDCHQSSRAETISQADEEEQERLPKGEKSAAEADGYLKEPTRCGIRVRTEKPTFMNQSLGPWIEWPADASSIRNSPIARITPASTAH
jgi:hypothetical protein